jgi:ABC-type lipoprotein release transport system permease subunit
MSLIHARLGSHLDMGVVAQVRTHPTVDRVIPCVQMTMLDIAVPPFGSAAINPYSVYAQDMAYLTALYDLELKEGHLPHPNTNEIVIPEVVAQNRNLHVGDVIGNRDRPAYPGAMALPTDFVISGIFAKPKAPEDENWLAFTSLEFLQNHGAFPILEHIDLFLVTSRAGQKAAMDDWLEAELAQISGVQAFTYRQSLVGAREGARTTLLTMALIESVVAVVAAIALAVLNIISIVQRQSELGILHAFGRARLWLVWRTVRETAFTTGIAWGVSALLCLMGLVYLQVQVFGPLGLRFDLFNLTPWLFTLPIPVAVLAVSTGTIARTLSKLDPVSIIERR